MKKVLLLPIMLFLSIDLIGQVKMPKMEFKKGEEVICPAGKIGVQTRVEMPKEIEDAIKNRNLKVGLRPKKSNIIVTYIDFPDPVKTSFERAVQVWEEVLESDVPIRVTARWQKLGENVLGSASPGTYYRNFPGAKSSNTWYPIALAEKLAGKELNDPGSPDINCSFSSDQDWYYPLDGTPPANRFHLATVVLHELGHGLGFVSSMNVSSNRGSYGFGTGIPNIFDTHILNGDDEFLVDTDIFTNSSTQLREELESDFLFFDSQGIRAINNNENPKLYAPRIYDPGSSISHLNDETYPAGSENSLMTSAVSPGELNYNPGPFVSAMFADMGWKGTSISHENIKNSVSIPSSVEVRAKVISDVGVNISTGTLSYIINSTSANDIKTVPLRLEGNELVGTISLDGVKSEVFYFFEITDNKNEVIRAPAQSPISFFFTAGEPDTFGPSVNLETRYSFVISESTIPMLVYSEDFYEEGVDNVKVEYSVNGGSTQSIDLKKLDPTTDTSEFASSVSPENAFLNETDFGPFQIGDKIRYQIISTDASGNSTSLPVEYTSGSSEAPPTPTFYEFAATSFLPQVVEYESDFNEDNGDFANIGFSIDTPSNFSNGNLHTSNPYGNGLGGIVYTSTDTLFTGSFERDEIALLRSPIVLTSDNSLAQITFDEVVLIEPGETGSTFNDADFYDYVVVEGSLDNGMNWFPFADGYDSRTNSAFLNEYNSGFTPGDYPNSTGDGSSALFKNRKISIYGSDLTTDFADLPILIRFRLHTDQLSYAWGWAIDNLYIQKESETILAAEPILNDGFLNVYPNPSTDFVNINLTLTKPQSVKAEIYSPIGGLMYSKVYTYESGDFSQQINVKTLSTGTYFMKISTAEGIRVRRLLIKR